ncbi:MAG: hypothetical protein AAGB05_07720 [Pseudomonadota bacterium]
MTDAPTTADILFWVPSNEMLPAAAAEALFADDPSQLGAFNAQEGMLKLTCGDEMVEIFDPVFYIVPLLCFDALADLAATGTALREKYSDDSTITLRRAGDRVEVMLDDYDDEIVTFPAAEFMSAMAGLGAAFLALSDRLWPDLPAHIRDALHDRAAKARDAVASAGA